MVFHDEFKMGNILIKSYSLLRSDFLQPPLSATLLSVQQLLMLNWLCQVWFKRYINEWMSQNFLKLNADKTEILSWGRAM